MFTGIIDCHQDTLSALLWEDRDFFERSSTGQVDLPRLTEGGVGAALLALFVEPDFVEEGLLRLLRQRDVLRGILQHGAGQIGLASTVEDLVALNEAGKFAVILHLEGADCVDEDFLVLRALYDLGLRSLGITWSRTNRFAEGVGSDNQRNGLSAAGIRLVEECNRLGILLDVSHLNDEGFWDVIKHSKHPVIATHSNSRTICPHHRNLTDEQIMAIAASGGVVGINFASCFLSADMREEAASDLSVIVAHIDYIAGLTGTEHIAFGSDYDGRITPPAGLEDVSSFPRVLAALRTRGYSLEDVENISSGNMIRVMREVWGGK